MAFKKDIMFVRARDPQTGRFISPKDLRRSVIREVVRFDGKHFKTVYSSKEAKRLTRAEYKVKFLGRIEKYRPVIKTIKTDIHFDYRKDIFLKETIENHRINGQPFIDLLINNIIKLKSSIISFNISVEGIKTRQILKSRIKERINKFSFDFIINVNEMKAILNREAVIEKIYKELLNKISASIYHKFSERNLQFSARDLRNINPETGKSQGHNKGRKRIYQMDITIEVNFYEPII